jgi:hypothetical protein
MPNVDRYSKFGKKSDSIVQGVLREANNQIL